MFRDGNPGFTGGQFRRTIPICNVLRDPVKEFAFDFMANGMKGATVFGILTILPEEFAAVSRLFDCGQNIIPTQYFVHAVAHPGDNTPPHYDVVVCQTSGQTNQTASDAARDFIEDFSPEYILLIGIAGGHGDREVNLGDVVIADFIEDSEYFKFSKGKAWQRKRPYDHPSYWLRYLHAEPLCKLNDWHKHIDVRRPDKKSVHATVANLASGDKLLGDPTNAYQKRLLRHFDKAAVFEMEGFGLASQVFRKRGSVDYNPQYLIIRGVSDLVNKTANEETRKKWKSYAACAAAAFGKELVTRILTTRRDLERAY